MINLLLALAAQGCQPFTTDLMAGQHHDVGDVTVTNTGDTLRIDVELSAGAVHHQNATIYALHIYAGFGPPPTNQGGNVAPGQFPYQTDFPSGVTSHTELIPLSDLGAICGDTLQIAVHAEVSCNSHPDETGWGLGNHPFTGGQWGWWMDYTLCCTSSANFGMELSVSPLVIGQAATVSVTGAQPAETITIYRSSKPILMGSGYTSPSFGATVLDIQAPVRPIGSAVADATGRAALSLTIPAGAPLGSLMSFQAVALRSPDAACSDAVYGWIL
jgi:hypothetical protein